MKFMRNEEGFTGLEAAIVLIAFVVVAAVFSYVMLGAGFFTSQKSQEVVHTSVQQASSSVEVVGNVIGLNNTGATGTTGPKIGYVLFTLATTAGGSSYDISNIVMTYTDNSTSFVLGDGNTYTGGKITPGNPSADTDEWTVQAILNGDDDVLIEPGEQFVINASLNKASVKTIPNNPFALELRPSEGASLQIKRTVPAQIDAVNLLY